MEKSSPEVARILGGAFKDPDPYFRIELLQPLADKAQTLALTSTLLDPNREVRKTAEALLKSYEQN